MSHSMKPSIILATNQITYGVSSYGSLRNLTIPKRISHPHVVSNISQLKNKL